MEDHEITHDKHARNSIVYIYLHFGGIPTDI